MIYQHNVTDLPQQLAQHFNVFSQQTKEKAQLYTISLFFPLWNEKVLPILKKWQYQPKTLNGVLNILVQSCLTSWC